MKNHIQLLGLVGAFWLALSWVPLRADEPAKSAEEIAKEKEILDKIKSDPAAAVRALQIKNEESLGKGDSAWMLVASAFVMLMVPGLALFYGGMVRRKNVLATMMQSMVCLAIVGVFWITIGYSLAFGKPWIASPFGKGSILGWSADLFFLKGIEPGTVLNGTNIPVYLHMLFQGMFAIITPALISGAIAERIRFLPYLIFTLLWVTLVYCPLAHMVWAQDWWTGAGDKPVGVLGVYGALDFAGGTVVHIAAGFSSLAAFLVLRKRLGYPEHAIHPSSMVLTLTGAGLLWFGWFGFNGGSGLASGETAVSAFAATQAAAAAGLSWMLVEWLHRGKPTALGLASGIVAGLVAVTPASGFIYPWGGLAVGLVAGVVCYVSVSLKPKFGYDDSLDAFGVHGIGGFLGAVLTGVFCYAAVQKPASKDGLLAGQTEQVILQLVAALVSAVMALTISLILVKLVDLCFGFVTDNAGEIEGLDHTEHGETGFDFGLAMEAEPLSLAAVPRPAKMPPISGKRFHLLVEGPPSDELAKEWSGMCQPAESVPAEFRAIYPFMTTVQGNRFQFRGGDQKAMRDNLEKLLQGRIKSPVKVRLENGK